jgi:hypothetical protein
MAGNIGFTGARAAEAHSMALWCIRNQPIVQMLSKNSEPRGSSCRFHDWVCGAQPSLVIETYDQIPPKRLRFTNTSCPSKYLGRRDLDAELILDHF